MVLHYLANVRLPTEKAHGLQIVENCDALSRAGARVTLVVPRRLNRANLQGRDIWSHYDIEPTFAVRRVACIDLFPFGRWLDRVSAAVQLGTYTIAAAFASRRSGADVYYSRDVLPLLALGLFLPRQALVYEAHRVASSRVGAWLQRACLRRVAIVFAVTERLASDLRQRGAQKVVVLRDGFRAARFAHLPEREEARTAAGIPHSALCIGYLGQLETMGVSKGLDLVVETLGGLADPSIHLCLVGGPPARAEALRSLWLRSGLSPDTFHSLGDVPPGEAAGLLAAFDVCLLTLPWTTHFAHHASPLKLFEYMAAGRAIVASSLPSIDEVLSPGHTAILVPPGDGPALLRAIVSLRDDGDLRERLGAAAREASREFSWDVRARRVLEALGPIK
jgi:glycosyltransferase involved in cell wall biosynthesis